MISPRTGQRTPEVYDYLLVGGGLQNGLIALALAECQPRARVALVEAGDTLGGNHTWSFHAEDLPAQAKGFVAPLITANWPGYYTRFGQGKSRQTRWVPSSYGAISSARFHEVVGHTLAQRGWPLWLGHSAREVSAGEVLFNDGTRLCARVVIDARGPQQSRTTCLTEGNLNGSKPTGGYQKFIGFEVRTRQPWPHTMPVIMDATLPQTDGFHFVYVLPFEADRVLVEDTYFSDTPDLDTARLEALLDNYITDRTGPGWHLLRRESGVLPMPWETTDPAAVAARGGAAPHAGGHYLRAGYAGGWFHPATGYSLPVAVRLALAIASASPETIGQAAGALADELAPRWRFARFLNRLLFTVVAPPDRWQIFARLYRTLPPGVLARFYALQFSPLDALRILWGRPPRLRIAGALSLIMGAQR